MEHDFQENRHPVLPATFAISERAVGILEAIAQGHSYEQILKLDSSLTYRDIFDAAQEALSALVGNQPVASRMAQVRKRHPRAYEHWTPEEEDQLRVLINEGETVARIAGKLQRERGGIRSRIIRLGLVEKLSSKEKERLQRIVERGTMPQAEHLEEHGSLISEEPAHEE